jgi:MFS family permease
MRTEHTYYLVFGLYSLSWSFLGPVYALFLLSRGLDFFQINAVLAVYLIAAFVFEVPTGAVADRVGRKLSFLLSCAVRTAAFALYASASSFADCLLAEFIDAAGSTLASGALEAWAVDGIRSDGDRRPVDRVFARAQAVSRTLMIASGLVSGYVAEHNIAAPWVMGAVGFAITGCLAAAVMREPARQAAADAARPSLAHTVGEGFAVLRRTPVLRFLCFVTLAAAFAIMPVHQTWQPRMQALTGQGTALMGWIWALINTATIAGSVLLPRLLPHVRRSHMLVAVTLWRGLSIVAAALATDFTIALIALLCAEVGFGLSEPMLQAWTNEHVEPAQRAMLLSVRAMAFTLGGGVGLVGVGLVARAAGIPVAWLVSGGILVFIAPLFVVASARAGAAAVPAERS